MKCRLLSLPAELMLQLCEILPLADLACLLLSNKYVHKAFERVLYRRDLRAGPSKAILWATLLSGTKGELERALAILKKSVTYSNGQVHENLSQAHTLRSRRPQSLKFEAQASPIILAAAFASQSFTQKLLQLSPDLRVFGFQINKFIPNRFKGAMYSDLLHFEENMACTGLSPVAYALRRDNRAIIKLLINAEHTVDLRQNPWMYHQFWPYPTTLHYFAGHGEHLSAFIPREASRFPATLNFRMTQMLQSIVPLHLAIECCNMSAFREFIALPEINVDVETSVGRTALHISIELCWKSGDPVFRKDYQQMCFELIDRGADVNKLAGGAIDETPLIVAMRMANADWAESSKSTWPIIERLLEKGANINDMTGQGTTTLNVLLEAIVDRQKSCTKTMEEKLKELVIRYGAEVNQLMPISAQTPFRHSLLGTCLGTEEGKTANLPLAKFLASRGARLHPSELSQFIPRLAYEKKLSWLDKTPYGSDVNPAVAMAAYEYVLIGVQDTPLATQLLEWLPWPTQANALIHRILYGDDIHPAIRRFVVNKGSDPRKLVFDATGQNLLHHLVRTLKSDESYSEANALADAKILIERGAMTVSNPAAPMGHKFPVCAIKYLRYVMDSRKKNSLRALLCLFYEAQARERGEEGSEDDKFGEV